MGQSVSTISDYLITNNKPTNSCIKTEPMITEEELYSLPNIHKRMEPNVKEVEAKLFEYGMVEFDINTKIKIDLDSTKYRVKYGVVGLKVYVKYLVKHLKVPFTIKHGFKVGEIQTTLNRYVVTFSYVFNAPVCCNHASSLESTT